MRLFRVENKTYGLRQQASLISKERLKVPRYNEYFEAKNLQVTINNRELQH
jgi:hypothetical protein